MSMYGFTKHAVYWDTTYKGTEWEFSPSTKFYQAFARAGLER